MFPFVERPKLLGSLKCSSYHRVTIPPNGIKVISSFSQEILAETHHTQVHGPFPLQSSVLALAPSCFIILYASLIFAVHMVVIIPVTYFIIGFYYLPLFFFSSCILPFLSFFTSLILSTLCFYHKCAMLY